MLLNCFFLTESHNPDLPEEEWTLVYENTTPGAYSQNFGWGKYKVVMSGGGGSGAALIRYSSAVNMEGNDCYNGAAAAQETAFVNVLSGENKTFSGIIGAGGGGSYVLLDGAATNASYGAVGTGYQNGSTANTIYRYVDSEGGVIRNNTGAWVGGSGGGSTGLEIDGVLVATAAGGNGGNVGVNYGGYKMSYGGTGGSGGTTSGTGSAGGANVNVRSQYSTSRTSGAGDNGYVRIYKSNLKPEPI